MTMTETVTRAGTEMMASSMTGASMAFEINGVPRQTGFSPSARTAFQLLLSKEIPRSHRPARASVDGFRLGLMMTRKTHGDLPWMGLGLAVVSKELVTEGYDDQALHAPSALLP